MEHALLRDRKLPGLARALEGEAMRAPLAEALRQAPGFGHELLRVEPLILKYTPGKRCVLEYRLFTRKQPEQPQRLIAKMYRKERGRIIFENLLSLWRASTHDGASGLCLRMPEPIAYLPAVSMVLQSVAPGRQLSTLAVREDLTAAVPLIAQNLAALHRLNLDRGESKTLADHLAKYCHPGPEALGAACPESAPLVAQLVEGLLAERLPSAALVPAHGDLNLAQIFVSRQAAFFIDFDGFCRTHAALDLGNFLVTLQTHFGETSAELEEAFLQTYREHTAVENFIGLHVYQAFAYLRRAMIAFRGQMEPNWQAYVRQLLEKGCSLLSQTQSNSPVRGETFNLVKA